MTPTRPRFRNPPLIERAISIAFEPLPDFSLGDYGLFWSQIMDEFPTSESLSPIETTIETYDGFQPINMSVQVVPASVLPRAVFRNDSAGLMVQVQPNRFGFNWIKVSGDHQYPHSEALLEKFYSLLTKFESFIESRGLGQLSVVQCDLTNVNAIPVHDVGESFVDMATVIRMPALGADCHELKLENQLIGAKHVFVDEKGVAIGRVHSIGQPSRSATDGQEAYRLDIAARGAPLGSGRDGIERFFSQAVSAINAVFLATATQSGRKFWGEIDA